MQDSIVDGVEYGGADGRSGFCGEEALSIGGNGVEDVGEENEECVGDGHLEYVFVGVLFEYAEETPDEEGHGHSGEDGEELTEARGEEGGRCEVEEGW